MSPPLTESPASGEHNEESPIRLSSSEKKRLRDRRAQRTLRERRDNQLKLLQQEVADCHRLHDHEGNRRLTERVQRLEDENQLLRQRQEELQYSLGSWSPLNESRAHPLHRSRGTVTQRPEAQVRDEVIPTLDSPHSTPATTSSLLPDATLTSPSAEQAQLPIIDACLAPTADSRSERSLIPVTQLLAQNPEITAFQVSDLPTDTSGAPPFDGMKHRPLSLQVLPPLVPAWMLTPPNDDPRSALSIYTSPWLSRPDLITECPNIPSPLDLLHGTRRNFLANSIHHSLRVRNCRDPEVLAMGWLVYVYSKWLISPSPETFSRIAPCMRPVMGQLQKSHPACLDHIIWPRLRRNMMQFCPKDKMLDVVSLLSCCLKVRWKWGESILVRDENDDLQIRPSFFDNFMTAEGWGLTSEFTNTHPDLVDGMDPSQLLYVPT
ncbi:hypothetical protein N7468_004474 [Penicillium chermesinum]|uniref:BZIP transcription factor n=1 Tax=Penicillium chermesinum TaxID=63820 RepID=A0A9W9P8L0_9EURO|nr:uncharacterized protein N7468_004474 [Penicillium chermesinum]KAJ5239855.1 hypothetical protein N7468_004474 [Penicillium chermesinum]KAJ6166734.1 hypothetical protein N7470_002181 [Penicillium chermesinum]